MRKFLTILSLGLSMSFGAAYAADAATPAKPATAASAATPATPAAPEAKAVQQSKMAICNKEAGDKKLKGDERKAFMKSCLSNKG